MINSPFEKFNSQANLALRQPEPNILGSKSAKKNQKEENNLSETKEKRKINRPYVGVVSSQKDIGVKYCDDVYIKKQENPRKVYKLSTTKYPSGIKFQNFVSVALVGIGLACSAKTIGKIGKFFKSIKK